MFWTIFFAVVAAMFAPMLVAWLVIGGVGIAGWLAALRARNPDAVGYWLWFGAVVIPIGMAIALASSGR